MKLLKIIEILKDIDNWDNDKFTGIIHKPTGIYCYGGYNFWKDGKNIYEPNFWAGFLTVHYVNVIYNYINKKKENTLDDIYNKWYLEYKTQDY